jgi:hypothetical protein
MKKDSSPKPTVMMPSIMKIQAQPGRPALPFRFSIAAARRPPKEPEKAAAEKKIAWKWGISSDWGWMERMGGRWTYGSDAKFVALVPAGEEVVDSGVETGFCHS